MDIAEPSIPSSPSSTAGKGALVLAILSLMLAILSGVVLYVGIETRYFKYESELVFLPLAAIGLATLAIGAALNTRHRRGQETPLAHTALVLGALVLVAPAPIGLLGVEGARWLGVLFTVLALGVFVLPVERTPAVVPPLLGVVSLLGWVIAMSGTPTFRSRLAWTLGLQLLALLGLHLGSAILARRPRASPGLAYGLASCVLTLALPLTLLLLLIYSED